MDEPISHVLNNLPSLLVTMSDTNGYNDDDGHPYLRPLNKSLLTTRAAAIAREKITMIMLALMIMFAQQISLSVKTSRPAGRLDTGADSQAVTKRQST